MARRIKPPAKPSAPDSGADDLSILKPDVELELAGRKLTVREYRFVGGLRARAKGKPLTDDLAAMMDAGDALEATAEEYIDLLAKHQELVRQLIVDSVDGADADWVEGLDDADGETLLVNWWVVCGRFFVRLALRRLLAQVQRRISGATAGSTSATDFAPLDTAAQTNSSPATPNAN